VGDNVTRKLIGTVLHHLGHQKGNFEEAKRGNERGGRKKKVHLQGVLSDGCLISCCACSLTVKREGPKKRRKVAKGVGRFRRVYTREQGGKNRPPISSNKQGNTIGKVGLMINEGAEGEMPKEHKRPSLL